MPKSIKTHTLRFPWVSSTSTTRPTPTSLKPEMNADVYYSIAGDDADFLIGGDIASLDFRTRLKNLQMPTLILAGRFDRVCSSQVLYPV